MRETSASQLHHHSSTITRKYSCYWKTQNLRDGRKGLKKDTELGGKQGRKKEKKSAMTRDMRREAESGQKAT